MEKKDGGLKHLGFVRLFAANTVLVMSNFYVYAKQNSGSLKSTIGTVENAVTTVIGPVYHKTKGYPEEALQYIDKKVDDLAPPLAKNALIRVDKLAQKAIEAGQHFLQEAKLGPHNAIDLVSSSIKNYAVGALHVLGSTVNRYPVLRAGTDMVLPTVSHCSVKYNRVVTKMAARGYPLFGYFPVVPIDDILKAFINKPVEQAQAKEGAEVDSSKTN